MNYKNIIRQMMRIKFLMFSYYYSLLFLTFISIKLDYHFSLYFVDSPMIFYSSKILYLIIISITPIKYSYILLTFDKLNLVN